jgi:hypothetical protein
LQCFAPPGSNGDESWPDSLSLQPIVAWEIVRTEDDRRPSWDQHVSDELIPLTTDGNMNHWTNTWAIKTPEGKYDLPGDTTFDHEVDLIRELRKRYDLVRRASVAEMQRTDRA